MPKKDIDYDCVFIYCTHIFRKIKINAYFGYYAFAYILGGGWCIATSALLWAKTTSNLSRKSFSDVKRTLILKNLSGTHVNNRLLQKSSQICNLWKKLFAIILHDTIFNKHFRLCVFPFTGISMPSILYYHLRCVASYVRMQQAIVKRWGNNCRTTRYFGWYNFKWKL